jgi:hypothetical protein
MPFLLLKYYVVPYQIGTGEILHDGSVNWNTVEALITLTVFMLHVPLTPTDFTQHQPTFNNGLPGSLLVTFLCVLTERTASRICVATSLMPLGE